MTITKRSHAHKSNYLALRRTTPFSVLLAAALAVHLLAGCTVPNDPEATDTTAEPVQEALHAAGQVEDGFHAAP